MTNSKHPLEGNCLYFQSGGPTAVINTSFLGVYETFLSLKKEEKFFVSRYGISSLLDEKLEEVKGDYSFLRAENGAHFGSLRKMLPMEEDSEIGKEIVSHLQKNQIRYVFVNGGNDSMDTAYKINRYCLYHHYSAKVFGIPKTIDNDLFGTDHTPGFGSAAKFVANNVITLTRDEYSYRKGKILLIETMGRDSGYLAASSSLAALRGYKPDYIYVPEAEFDIDSFLDKVTSLYERKGHAVIVLSEGIKDKTGALIAGQGKADAFGNLIPGGVAGYLASLLQGKGFPTRFVELNTLQRSASYLLSKTDTEEAYEVGKTALLSALKGETGKMVGMKRISEEPYRIEYILVDLVKCRKDATSMPVSYLNESGDNINDSFLTYAAPLVCGNVSVLEEDGLLS